MEKANSAARLSAIIRRIPSVADEARVYRGWAEIFGLDESEGRLTGLLVAQRLVWANRELEELTGRLEESMLRKSTYEGAVNAVFSAFNPSLLGGQWRQVKAQVNDAHRAVFEMLVDITPEDEAPLTEEDIAHLRELAVGMLNSLDELPKLPIQLESLIRHHAEMILVALDEYRFVGAKALRRAQYIAWGEIQENQNDISQHNKSDAISKLGKAWTAVAEACDKATKIGKAGILVHDILKLIHGAG